MFPGVRARIHLAVFCTFLYAATTDYCRGRIWGYVGIHMLRILFMLLRFLCKRDFSNCVNGHCFKTGFVFYSSNKLYTNRR